MVAAGRLWVLSDMFVHFELWVDEREGIVPRCLIPAHSKKQKVNPQRCNMKTPSVGGVGELTL
jgi:hypothetical protein